MMPDREPGRERVFTTCEYFEGKLNAISKPNRLMYFNEEFRPGFAGHMALLNLKTFVWPQFLGIARHGARRPLPAEFAACSTRCMHKAAWLATCIHSRHRTAIRRRSATAARGSSR